ncbi:conserved Plasmodium protein, unknown function [Plasmodium berghei]|uniref:Uncharacterized protein n=2 Tax=Plasmodium berghei TaxID=5821 RepID=A0A509AGU9_PLABA|nr:conserved Plasmodium protein, unknown function [Plasmodium berghei ANKA]SCM21083.1 conserved Plasmodium protein, unknown function [Plasmodium berghei]SCN24451.1 conserved Plasmodium protein, unknown function [Plasmodium berghei]SCO60819.1 conserved Plasmodium protein, unknown function [Plasmodium berghei]VUC55310.1 conserved Plasmodium protein, unknown function [Plasmodium berghei ANKA]|eukprot:XP_034421123.1 conserved Plasmodium protein, unknown function [Plasmodium berghei ANKA]
MEKEILLSLAHNANAQIKNEITEVNDEIIFLNTKLDINKNSKLSNIVKTRCNKRKQNKSEELNNFFFKYIMFLLSNKSNDNIEGTHFYNMIQKNVEINGKKSGRKNGEGDLLNEQSIYNKKRDENFLKHMYEKKNELEQILDLIKLNDLENLSDKQSEEVFSNLMLKLNMETGVENENILNFEGIDKEMSELNISENMKQNLLKYLIENISDPNIKNCDLSTVPSTVSLIDTSEKESDLEELIKYDNNNNNNNDNNNNNNNRRKINELFKNGESSFNTPYSNKCELYGKNNIENSIYYNKKSPSFGSIFLKKDSQNILLNKFNASRKSFNELRQNTNKSFSTNEVLIRKKEKKKNNKKKKKNNNNNSTNLFDVKLPSLKKQTKEHIINKISDNKSLIQINKCENNQNCNNKEKPTLLNKYCPIQLGNKNNKNKFSEKNDYNKKLKEDISSSDSSLSESKSIENLSKNEKNVGFKKLYLKINKEGKGEFIANKKKGSNCSKYIYDFEIVYENDETLKQNECEENMNEKDKNKNIFHLSFLTNGKKVYKVNNLDIENYDIINNLKIINHGKNTKINTTRCQNKQIKEIIEKGLSESLNSNKEDEYKDEFSEFDVKNVGNTNICNKYELKKIERGYRQRKKLYSKKKENNFEFRETNKIRGLYIHMLDRQNQLEIEKEFYKKEFEKLQEDIKNNTAPINEYLKEEKLKHFEIEKIFYKKEKQFIKKKNLLKKKMLEIENQLEIAEKKLIMEKEKNENLFLKIQDEKNEIEKRESVNESKIKNLNSELDKLNKSILLEQKEKDDLLNELNILKHEDIEFGNFRKNILDKINKTNGDIKYLAEILELLTKELEKKNLLQNLNEKKIKELEENSQKTENILRITKGKLLLEKKKKKNLFKEITHLNRKNKELGKCIKDIMFRQNSEINFKENTMHLIGISSDYEQNQNKKSTLLYDSTSKTNVSFDSYDNMLHYKIQYNCNNNNNLKKKKKNSEIELMNNTKGEYYSLSDKNDTTISGNSSLFLFNPNTKSKISFNNLIESMDDLSEDATPALKHNIVCNFKTR